MARESFKLDILAMVWVLIFERLSQTSESDPASAVPAY